MFPVGGNSPTFFFFMPDWVRCAVLQRVAGKYKFVAFEEESRTDEASPGGTRGVGWEDGQVGKAFREPGESS